MAQGQEITVRRAKPSDVSRIAAFVNRALQGPSQVDEQKVIERFGGVGFLVAERSGDLVGMMGWLVENLVVRVTDFLIWPASEREAAGRALIAEMERAAAELQCETALLFLPRPNPLQLVQFCRTLGYEPQVVGSMPKAWREAAREARVEDDDTVLIKQLRSDRVFRPL